MLDALCVRRLGNMRGHQLGGSHDRAALVVGAVGYSASAADVGTSRRHGYRFGYQTSLKPCA